MTDTKLTWTDINSDSWINKYLHPKVRPYAQLMRLDRPIGTWLLLWPCLWSVALASSTFPNFRLLLLFTVGSIVMRGAGCVINDIYDLNLDKQVERTCMRPLASGQIKIWQSIVLLVVLLLIGLRILLFFNYATLVVGCLSLFLIFSYPLMKRITWWPQLFLGLTFNWGAFLGWISVCGTLGAPPLLLYLSGVAWTLGYDTIYAYQDIKDDTLVGIKSTARLFDKNGVFWVKFFYFVAILVLVLTGISSSEGVGFYVTILGLAILSLFQINAWDMNNQANCLDLFRRNRDFGLIVFTAIILGKWL